MLMILARKRVTRGRGEAGSHSTWPTCRLFASAIPTNPISTFSPATATSMSHPFFCILLTTTTSPCGNTISLSLVTTVPVSTFPATVVPKAIDLNTSVTDSLTGLSASLWGICSLSIACSRVPPVYHARREELGDNSLMLSPVSPDTGTKVTADGLNPAVLRKGLTSSSICAKRVGSLLMLSILLTATMSCDTPRLRARMACSLV
mmetsp:Transcript_49010/g.96120  ORF Transcript_49010/g.96120 Transcript_49010/m.96120 type:complete len:205 (-) Transcript_49010:1189-1803(-)